MRQTLLSLTTLLTAPALSVAAHLSPPAEKAFEDYSAALEARLPGQPSGPRLGDDLAVEPVNGGTWEVSGGLMHHWRGAALVRDASSQDMLALLRDYNHFSRYYAPEVVSSWAVSDSGEKATLAMRFKKQQVVTVVLDTEFEIESGLDGDSRGYSFSRSRHIWQIDRPGTMQERRREEGADDGFLWRLNSYWSFVERRDGLFIECEAVSLTRDVPSGLGWLIAPIIKALPRASLEFTLTATRNALATNAMGRHTHDHLN